MIQRNTVQLAPAGKYCQLVSLMLSVWIFCIVGDSYGGEQQPSNRRIIDGEIVLDIVEPPEKHSMFLVKPREGTVTRFTGSAKPESTETSSGTRVIPSCHNNPTSVSPDHKFVAECQGAIAPTNIGSKPDHFILRQAGSTAMLFESDFGQAIIGFLWSQDSQAIAVLSQTVRVSWNPRYWFYALSGHPMQYETYSLHMIAVADVNVTTFKVPYEASFSAGYLIAWTQNEKKEAQ